MPCRAVGVYRLLLCSGRGRAAAELGRVGTVVVEKSNPASARDVELRLDSARGDCPLVRLVENSNPASARDVELRLDSARGDCALVRLVKVFVHIFLMSLDT